MLPKIICVSWLVALEGGLAEAFRHSLGTGHVITACFGYHLHKWTVCVLLIPHGFGTKQRMPAITICAVNAACHDTYCGSDTVPLLSEKIVSSFPKIHSSTSPLALISRKAQFPPQLVERINTPSVFCLHPSLATCILATSLGFIFSVVLSSNSRFASFDFVLHWLEFFHPPLSSFTVTLLALTKIPTVTFSQGGFYAQGGKRSPFQ